MTTKTQMSDDQIREVKAQFPSEPLPYFDYELDDNADWIVFYQNRDTEEKTIIATVDNRNEAMEIEYKLSANLVTDVMTYCEVDTYTDDETGITWVKVGSYGDYHGSSVDRANIAYFDKEYPNNPDFSRFADGCHGYVDDSLWLRNDTLNEAILDNMESLSQYPIADDDMHSQIEQDMQQEAWDNWADWDFARELTNIHPAYDWLSHRCEQVFWHLCYQFDNGDIFLEETGGFHVAIERLLNNDGVRESLYDAMVIFQGAIFNGVEIEVTADDHPVVVSAAQIANLIIEEANG